ncbi:MAG: MerR family transcriptional regulator [Thermodesulfobacteriota bacterium]|nr:MerR family transcriptional regulator [Thermodesulfobacteriota bacterium]
MNTVYPANLVRKLTGATINQLKYWVRTGLVLPERKGKFSFYSFKDIVKLRVLVSLKRRGLSLQKMRKGISNLSGVLPDDEALSRLVIYTDGVDMIVVEKGKYFSAVTKQRYFRFDTEQIGAEIIRLQNYKANYIDRIEPLDNMEKAATFYHGQSMYKTGQDGATR